MQLSWKQQQVYRGATPLIVSTASGNSSDEDTGEPVWQSCGDESESYLALMRIRNEIHRDLFIYLIIHLLLLSFFTKVINLQMKIQKVFNGKEILTNGDTCNNTSLCLPYTKDNKQSNKKEEKMSKQQKDQNSGRCTYQRHCQSRQGSGRRDRPCPGARSRTRSCPRNIGRRASLLGTRRTRTGRSRTGYSCTSTSAGSLRERESRISEENGRTSDVCIYCVIM